MNNHGVEKPGLTTIDVIRKGYGRRYSFLPVDTLDLRGFLIDCTNCYMRPTFYDIQPGDTVRWFNGNVHLQGMIATVERSETQLRATFEEVLPIPSEYVLP